MAFSFNPGQIAPQGGQTGGPSGVSVSGPSASQMGSTTAGNVSNPSSPFLFMHDRDKPIDIMACVQIGLMAITALFMITCVVLFAYSVYLTASANDKKTQLDAKDAEVVIKETDIQNMKRLSNRFAAVNILLQGYISPRSPLKFLEQVVENQVYFNEFALNKNENGAGYVITFSIVTNNYRNLIQQLGALNLKEYTQYAPTPKPGEVLEIGGGVKVVVTTPVFVQGKLPDQIMFLDNQGTSSPVTTSSRVATSTP